MAECSAMHHAIEIVFQLEECDMVTQNQTEHESKQSYATPKLVNYGNVRTLTQAGRSGAAEGPSSSQNKKA